jgi:hypothetical protein
MVITNASFIQNLAKILLIPLGLGANAKKIVEMLGVGLQYINKKFVDKRLNKSHLRVLNSQYYDTPATGAKAIGGSGKNKYRHVFLRRLLSPNDENYFVKPAQWKNVNPKGSPDLRNNKHDAARYVRRSSHLNTCFGTTIHAVAS